MKTTRVNWVIRGTFECPYCDHEHDFMNVDEFNTWSEPGQNLETFHRAIEFECHNCDSKFHINGSDY